jgi:hypothetical protein
VRSPVRENVFDIDATGVMIARPITIFQGRPGDPDRIWHRIPGRRATFCGLETLIGLSRSLEKSHAKCELPLLGSRDHTHFSTSEGVTALGSFFSATRRVNDWE